MPAGPSVGLSIALVLGVCRAAHAGGGDLPIAIDLPASTITAGTAHLPAALLEFDARVAAPVSFFGAPPRVATAIPIEVTAPALPLASWRLEASCQGGPWLLVIASQVPLPPRMTWLGTAAGVQLVRPGAACAIRLGVTTAEGFTGYTAPRPVPLVAGLPGRVDAVVTGGLFTSSGAPTAKLQQVLRRFAARAAGGPPGDRHRVRAEVAISGEASATDRQMQLAAITAQLTRQLRGLGVPEERFHVIAEEGTAQVVTLATILAAPPAAPVVIIDGIAHPLVGGRLSTSVPAAPGSAMVLDITDDQGRRAIFTIAAP